MLHFYAAHGHTAADVIIQRANASLPFMGLTAFEGEETTREEVEIAKNYFFARSHPLIETRRGNLAGYRCI